jgi:predicted nicotinamide N-methyase
MNQNHHDVPAVLRDNLARTIRSSRLVRASLPLVPNIELFLLRPDYPVGKLDDQEMLAIINEPAYWAFCWTSVAARASSPLRPPPLAPVRSLPAIPIQWPWMRPGRTPT